MKKYLQARELLAEVEQVFANRHSLDGYQVDKHPLELALVVLLRGRNYVGLELTLEFPGKRGVKFATGSHAGVHAEFRVPVRVAARRLGELHAFTGPQKRFSTEDRVLLKEAGRRIARFLTGPGKYFVHHLGEDFQASASTTRVAAAGDRVR